MEIKKILIVGSGTLGLRIALQAAISEYTVVMYDLEEETLQRALEFQHKLVKSMVRRKVLREAGAETVMKRITATTNLKEACKDVDLVSESVTEDLEIKHQVWEELGRYCPEKTIFTTNTSYLLPSMMCEVSGRPAKFCAFHFHDVFTANVVDIMPHAGTDPEIVSLLKKVGVRLNQTPIVMEKESSGYIFNYMLMAVIGAAGNLKVRGVASVADIDRSWMGNFKTASGPFGMLDAIGLDTAWHVVKTRTDPKSRAFADLLKTYVDQKKLGVKTGEGFYTYPEPEYRKKDFVLEAD